MRNRSTEFIESFAYEGALGWGSAGALLLGLAIFIAWLLWCERRILGRGVATLFFAIRTLAVAVVLWMLLGPTHVAVERTTIPQTLAILLDSSQSMDIAEPMPAAESLRWQQVSAGERAKHPELIAVDNAVAALRHADSSRAIAEQAVVDFLPAEEVTSRLQTVSKALTRAAGHLSGVDKALAAYGEEIADLSSQLGDELQQVEASKIDELVEQFQSELELNENQSATMQEAGDDIERCLRRCETLQRTLVLRLLEDGASPDTDDAESQSRKQLSLASLASLEEGVLSELAKTVNIKRITIDEFAIPLTGGSAWPAPGTSSDNPKPATDQSSGDFELMGYEGKRDSDFGPVTNLTAALEMLSQDASTESIVAAVMYSDGGHNAPGVTEPIRVAAGLSGLPVHVAPICSHEPQRDLQLHRVDAPTSVGLDDSIVIEALVTGYHLDGERTTVELRYRGKVVEKRSIEFTGDRQDHRLRFTTPADTLGQHEFDLVAVPLDDETSVANNSAVLAVRVVRDTINVLLADRISRWEYRYLDMLFRRDKHVDFDKLLFSPTLVATGRLEATEELPRDVEGWSKYDVAILGDVNPKKLDVEQQESMAQWVRERGGHVVVIAGRQHMPHDYLGGPLAELLPVQKSPRLVLDRNGYMPSITPSGAMHDAVMLERTPDANASAWSTPFRFVPVYYLSPVCLPKPAAHTLIEAAAATDEVQLSDDASRKIERALLAWQGVGAGRVAYLASPVSWHLRFRRGDELHHRFWGQMLRWLTAAERGTRQNQLFVSTPDTRYEFGQPVEVVVTLSQKNGSPIVGADIEALANSQAGQPVATPLKADDKVPGRYLGRFDSLEPGAYRITASGDAIESLDADQIDSDGATALVTMYAPDNIELANTRGNRPLLEEIASVTGGQVLPPTAVAEILTLSALSPKVIENAERTPLWNRWRYFWIVVGCLTGEWFIRRMIGLV